MSDQSVGPAVSELFCLDGKRILVTGAAGYLGRQICWALAESGAIPIINGRSAAALQTFSQELNKAGYRCEMAPFDICDQLSIAHYFSLKRNEPLHCLINNAYHGETGNMVSSTCSEFDRAFEVTVTAAFSLIQHALPALERAVSESGDACVINIGTMYASVSPDLRIYEQGEFANPPYYGAAKAALLQLTRYAACEFGPRRIRVNAISPGPFPSPQICSEAPEFIERLEQKVPLARIGRSEELKGAVVFLASAASSYVTGINLPVDGGWTSW